MSELTKLYEEIAIWTLAGFLNDSVYCRLLADQTSSILR